MDLTPALLPRLLGRRLTHLDLGQDAVHLAYDGLSLLNVPASLSSWLGGPALPHVPLDISELQPLAEGVQQVVVALARGGGYLWRGPKADVLHGRHGGLTPDEMLVPFLAVRLA